VEYHRSAFKHGLDERQLGHALSNLLAIFDLDPDADPPRVFGIGPDKAGNLLELIWLELESDTLLIHAMPLRKKYFDLLDPEGPSP